MESIRGIRKAKSMTKSPNNMVQVADLPRFNCISWLPRAKSPGGGSNRSRTGSGASRAAGYACPGEAPGDFALHATSGSPLDCDKGNALDSRRMHAHSPFQSRPGRTGYEIPKE